MFFANSSNLWSCLGFFLNLQTQGLQESLQVIPTVEELNIVLLKIEL